MMASFGEWLLEQLKNRGWTQAELARRAHISQPTLSRIIAETRRVGPDAALAIARALGESPVTVYRLAGLLPPAPPQSEAEKVREIVEILASVPEGPMRDEAIEAMRAIAKGAQQRAMEQKSSPQQMPGSWGSGLLRFPERSGQVALWSREC